MAKAPPVIADSACGAGAGGGGGHTASMQFVKSVASRIEASAASASAMTMPAAGHHQVSLDSGIFSTTCEIGDESYSHATSSSAAAATISTQTGATRARATANSNKRAQALNI